jgi:hypothetical protein
MDGPISYSQVDITEGFGDNAGLGANDWVRTVALNETTPNPTECGLPAVGTAPDEVYRVASRLSALRESLDLPDDGVYCPLCHIANVDQSKLRTPCPQCGRELLMFGWD